MGKKTPEKADENLSEFRVGDRVKVNLHTGRIVDATVKAVIERTDGKRLQVDFEKDETALVHLWQVVTRVPRVKSFQVSSGTSLA
jgi:tRNA A58 N-methylase Trm61